MKYILILIFIGNVVFAQSKSIKQKKRTYNNFKDSKNITNFKNSSNNTILNIDKGTILNYNDKDGNRVLSQLNSELVTKKQANRIEKKIDKIAEKQNIDGYISIEAHDRSVGIYIIENNSLKERLSEATKLKEGVEFNNTVKKAQEQLASNDNVGVQETFEVAKQKIKNEQKNRNESENKKIAQFAYFQSQSYYENFQYKKALDLINEALDYENRNPEFKILKANTLRAINSFEDAITIYNSIDTTALNPVIKARLYVEKGRVYSNMGDEDTAIKYYNNSLFILLSSLSETNQLDIGSVYNDLASSYSNKGSYNESISYYNEALLIVTRYRGGDHVDVATIYNNLGIVYRLKKEYNKALEYYRDKALPILINAKGSDIVDLSNTYNNIGLIYYYKENFDEAIECYKEDLKISLELLGEESSYIAISYNNLGMAYHAKENYDKAIVYYLRALSIRRKIYKISGAKTQISLVNLAQVYIETSQFAEAIQYYKEVIKYKNLSIENRALYFNSVGYKHFEKKDYNKAVSYANIALYLLKNNKVSDQSIAWAITYDNLAKVYCFGNGRRAVNSFFKEAIEYSKRVHNSLLLQSIEQSYKRCKD